MSLGEVTVDKYKLVVAEGPAEGLMELRHLDRFKNIQTEPLAEVTHPKAFEVKEFQPGTGGFVSRFGGNARGKDNNISL